MKAKLLVSSAASILLFGAIAVGGTYSLFTSEGGADIAATAGKVSVKASLELLKTYSGQWDAEAETPAYKHVETAALGAFSNGGSAKVDSGVITLDKMTPMDKAEFKIAIENGSDVAVKYRTKFTVPEDGGLAEGLRITVDGREYDGMTTFSKWAEWTAQGEIEIPVSVELPEAAGNAYQGKSAKVQFVVEAVQANAHVEDVPEGEIWLYTPTDLIAFSNKVNNAKATTVADVKLMNDLDMGGRTMKAIGSLEHSYELKGTFDGQEHTVKNLKIEGIDDRGTGFFGSSANHNPLTVKGLTLKDCEISGTKNVGGILGMGYTADIENCVVEDCVITSEGKRAAGIAANMPSDGSIKDCVSKNNVITASGSGTNGPADIITYCTAGTTLSGNTFEGNELISYYEVTPENAQDVLNGKLGSINNAVIQLTPGVYQDLEFGMPTADADNGVTCHFNGFNTTAMTVAEFLADPNCGKPGYNSYYEREIKNLTIKGCEGAVIKNIKSGAGHYYDNTGVGNYDAVRGLTLQGSAYYLNHKYSNIAFENIDFEGYNDFETSMKDTLIDGMSFKGCTFKNSPSNKQALRIYNEWTHDTLVQTIKNVVVENCQFNNVYQGVYTGGVYGVTVKNSSFDGLTHNAIAVQNNGAAEFDHGKVWIEGNTFKNGADRLIRFNKVGADTQITIKNNTATECGDADGQVIKATSVNAAVTIACSGNNWGKKGTVTAYAVAPFADVAD